MIFNTAHEPGGLFPNKCLFSPQINIWHCLHLSKSMSPWLQFQEMRRGKMNESLLLGCSGALRGGQSSGCKRGDLRGGEGWGLGGHIAGGETEPAGSAWSLTPLSPGGGPLQFPDGCEMSVRPSVSRSLSRHVHNDTQAHRFPARHFYSPSNTL